MGIRLENSDGDLSNAERLVFDLGGVRLEFDGSFPRDVQTIYDWMDYGYGVQTLVEATDSVSARDPLSDPGREGGRDRRDRSEYPCTLRRAERTRVPGWSACSRPRSRATSPR